LQVRNVQCSMLLLLLGLFVRVKTLGLYNVE
jgi:hypothetical protein